MNNCDLCGMHKEVSAMTLQEIEMVTTLYHQCVDSDQTIMVCNICKTKTIAFYLHVKEVGRRQVAFVTMTENYFLAKKDFMKICRMCVFEKGDIDITTAQKLNAFISRVYRIEVDSTSLDHLKYICSSCFHDANGFLVVYSMHGERLQKIWENSVKNLGNIRNNYQFAPPAPTRPSSMNSWKDEDTNSADESSVTSRRSADESSVTSRRSSRAIKQKEVFRHEMAA